MNLLMDLIKLDYTFLLDNNVNFKHMYILTYSLLYVKLLKPIMIGYFQIMYFSD